MASLRSIGLEKIIIDLIKKGDATPDFLAILKRKTAKKHKDQFVTHSELIKAYHKLIKNETIAKNEKLETILRRRQIRTLSGVAVITVLTKPHSCPGQCLFCPAEKGMPKSYLKNEPAANRAFLTKFNPYAQVKVRLKALQDNGHPTDKIELIVLGGTWSAYPKNYQYWFIKECFRAANNFNKKNPPQPSLKGGSASPPKGGVRGNLKHQQEKNESAKNRIIGLTLETRPDCINLSEIKTMRDLGCTRVELGAQSVFDNVLKQNRRGHFVADTILATQLLKNAGFKINYHIMLNLPGSDLKRDEEVFRQLFSNQDFQPDLLKIYPCAVLKTAPLFKVWRKGNYKPYTEKELVNLLIKIKKMIPPYVRIQRIIRDIPTGSIVAGSKISNLRQLIEESGKKECHCIRCREIRGQYSTKEKIKLFRQDYQASGGQEIFLSFASPDQKKLYALLRLRISKNYKNKIPPNLPLKREGQNYSPSFLKEGRGGFNNADILPVLQDAALIRELHTYGQLINLGQKSNKKTQHMGLGKKLMLEAEKIAKKEFGYKKIAVISGVGVRGYYQKLGYRLKDSYMIKSL